MNNSTICPAPWLALAVQPTGVVVPCCAFSPDEDFKSQSTLDLNNNLWKEMRRAMLAGDKVLGCQNCYKNESLGTTSTRQNLLKWFGEPSKVRLEFLEMSFSNKCNIACVSCDSTSSSRWAAEDAKTTKNASIKFLKSTNLNLETIDLDNLTVLKLVGGEPLLEQKKCIEVLERADLSKLTLALTTNGTIPLTDKLANLIAQCKTVHFYISVDGIKSVNEWYRWPTKHAVVEKNIKEYLNWAKNKPNICIISHTVINVFNIWTLEEFISSMQAIDSDWNFDFDFIDEPNWQSISNIPQIFKNDLIDQLLLCSEKVSGNWNNNENPFLASIAHLKDSGRSTWEEVIIKSLRLASKRNLNLFDQIPELKDKFVSQ